MTQFGNMPAYPFHVDIVNVKRVTMSRLESTVIVTIEIENECILFYQMEPIPSEDQFPDAVRIKNIAEWVKIEANDSIRDNQINLSSMEDEDD